MFPKLPTNDTWGYEANSDTKYKVIGLKISYFEPPFIFNFDKLSSKLPVGITAPVSLEDATKQFKIQNTVQQTQSTTKLKMLKPSRGKYSGC